MGGRIPLESKAPYLGVEGQCEESAWTDTFGIINNYIAINPALNLTTRQIQMKEALTEGPVAIAIAVTESMVYYGGGVFNDPLCGYGEESQLDHEVTAVGWGHD